MGLQSADRILIIQTAFIGDVVLATPLVERLKQHYPQAEIDFLLRKGNEGLLTEDHRIHELLIWDKSKPKSSEIPRLIRVIRKRRYDLLVNVQRFATTGFLTLLSGAKQTIGFDKNPFSFVFSKSIRHELVKGKHEVDRNLALIGEESNVNRPSLVISETTKASIDGYAQKSFITIAPTSVWFTKQYPSEKWVEFLNALDGSKKVYLLGAPSDNASCEVIRTDTTNQNVVNLCGKLSLLQSAALMARAHMNYVNDSAPMHFASALNAPTTAIFCSTVPDFGFGPLADNSVVVENTTNLPCRPCGLHGYASCPEKHFKCADVSMEMLVRRAD